MNNLVIFDLDHTLLADDSNRLWSDYLLEKGLVNSAYIEQRDLLFADYLAGTLDFDVYLKRMLTPLAEIPHKQLIQYRKIWFETLVQPRLYAKGIACIRHHQQSGDSVLIISATNEFLVEPVSRYLDVSDYIGVQLERDDQGEFTGQYLGVPSFADGKLVRLQYWLDTQALTLDDFDASYFYSDSINDVPLLEAVSEPRVVHPDKLLQQYAQQKNWQILSFA